MPFTSSFENVKVNGEFLVKGKSIFQHRRRSGGIN
jgi:hypothetical protein